MPRPRRRGGSSELSEAIDQIDVEDYMADQGVDYRITSGSSGVQVNIRECPRCGGTDWKVFLNAETGLGNCFHGSCVGEPGYNLFSFTQHLLSLSARETAQKITEYAKTLGWKPKVKRTRLNFELPTDVKLPDSETLSLANNLDYLEDRGINGRIAERFGLRHCFVGDYDYIDHTGKKRAQDYSDRVIIPIKDFHGKLVTFQGRDMTGKAEKKYLFPPGLPGTGRYLYNAHRAKGRKSLVMGEGVFDVIAIDMAFADHEEIGAIGSFGKSFSASDGDSDDQLGQLALLKQAGAERLTFMWDSEPKTLLDACDAVEKIKRIIPDVRIAELPPGCDPNEATALQVRLAYAKAMVASKSNILKLKMRLKRGS